MDNGDLHGFQVREGNISINGQGLDTSGSDYTHLLTQAAQINAGIWTNNLNIKAGSYDIDSQGQISQKQPDGSNNSTGIAIDTAQLGGMYAGKITLVSNDKGVGVNNAGQIFAGAGGIVNGTATYVPKFADLLVKNGYTWWDGDLNYRYGSAAFSAVHYTDFLAEHH